MTATAKSRTIQVLRFLREFDQIRNKPLRHVRQHLDHLFRRDFPVGPGCRLHVTEFGVEEEDGADAGTPTTPPLLTVEKQRLTRPPPPPDALEEWLEVDGRDPDEPPVARATRTSVEAERLRSEPERFEDSEERAFDRWLENAWRPWAQRESPRRKVQALYEHLYELYLQLRRDTEEVELVWASGLLAWRLDGEEILHPLVLAPVSLLFDRDVGRLEVVPTAAAPELADDIFQGLTSRSFIEFDGLAREFRASPVAPWDRVEIRPLLGRVANVLSTRATLVDAAPHPGSDPVISWDDLLLLRKRRAGYGRDIERWLQIFEGDVEPPATVRQVVGVHGQGWGAGGARASDSGASPVWIETESLLFPLPVTSGPALAAAASEGGLESSRRALIRLREESVRPAFINTPPERGLLRRAMIEAFLTHRPTSIAEYELRMPQSMRAYTDAGQLRYLPEVFAILARLPRA